MKLSTRLVLIAAALAVPACAVEAPVSEIVDGPTGTETLALAGDPGYCTPKISGAAITYQTTTPRGRNVVSNPPGLVLELTTLSPLPFKMTASAFSVTPPGIGHGHGSTDCQPNAAGTKYYCTTTITAPVNLCTANGDYQIKFAAIADPGSGCPSGAEMPINLKVTTENLCTETTVGGTADDALVAIYKDGNYAGAVQELGEGFHDMAALTIGNDALSSLKVAPGWKVTLFADAAFGGASQTFTGDVPFVGAAWNDRASSVLVEHQ